MSTKDTTLPPLLVALKEKISEAIKVSDDVGRSRGSNCYAHNTRAVIKICKLQDSIARDLDALAAHDKEAAIRLRGICDDLGLVSAVPKTDEQLMESQFAVFGMIRRALARAAIAAQAPQADACGDSCAAFEAAFMSENGFHTKAELAVEWDKGLSGVMFRAGIQQAQQAQGVPEPPSPTQKLEALLWAAIDYAAARPAEAKDVDPRTWQHLLTYSTYIQATAPQAEPPQKPCLVAGACKHGSWCTETYCQEHCQFVKAEPQPEREPTTWSRYVAGMIACYLKWPDDDERTEAVAGIIERRRWSDRRTKSEPLSPVESESLQWLERLCEPALYLDRLGPIRDYLRAHGIGTKGGQ